MADLMLPRTEKYKIVVMESYHKLTAALFDKSSYSGLAFAITIARLRILGQSSEVRRLVTIIAFAD